MLKKIKCSLITETNEIRDYSKLSKWMNLLGTSIFGFEVLLFSVCSIFFLSGKNLADNNMANLILLVSASVQVMITFALLIKKCNCLKKTVISVIILFTILIGIFASCFVLAHYSYDLSYDGQAYHQEAINYLKEGWNPFYDELNNNRSLNETYIKYITCFPRIEWCNSAIVFRLTNDIEDGKIFNFLSIIAAFLVVGSTLIKREKRFFKAIISSVLLVFNPVVIYQMLTYYVDFKVYIVLISLSCYYLSYLSNDNGNDNKRTSLIGIFVMSIIGINTKFTGLGYVLVINFCFVFYEIIINRKLKSLYILIGSVGIGLFILGFNPYVTNIKNYGSPFYPIVGEFAKHITDGDLPSNFFEENRLGKLGHSIFSKSGNYSNSEVTELKLPGVITKDEILTFRTPDTRIGGFGPLFSLAIVGLLFFIFSYGRRKPDILYALAAGALFLSAMINYAVWWARYAPQLWAVIPLLYLAYSKEKDSKFAIRKILYFIGIGVLVLNIVIVSYVSFHYNIQVTTALNNQLKELSRNDETLAVNFGFFKSSRFKLDKYSIQYVETNDLHDNNIIGSTATYRIIDLNFGTKINFGTTGNKQKWLKYGWSAPEDGFNWTNGYTSVIEIPATLKDVGGSNLIIEIEFHPFIINEGKEMQQVKIMANGEVVENFEISKAGLSKRRFIVPNRLIKSDMLCITLGLPTAFSPKDIGVNEDARKHGIALHSITINIVE